MNILQLLVVLQLQSMVPGQVVARFNSPGCCPTGMAYDGKRLWIADRKEAVLFALDPKTGRQVGQLLAPGTHPTGLAFDGRHLWVVDRDEDSLFRLDPRSGEVDFVAPIKIRGPRGLAWDGECLFMASAKDDQIYCLDPDDATVVRKFPAPAGAVTGLTYDGRYLWAADRNFDELYRIDTEDGIVVGILPSPGPHPFGLACDGRSLLVADYQQAAISRVNIRDGGPLLVLGQKDRRIEYNIHFQNQGPGVVKRAEFFLAVPENRYHQRLLDEVAFSSQPAGFLFDEWGQKVARIVIDDIPPGQMRDVSMSVAVRLYHTRFWIVPERVRPLGTIPKAIRRDYLANDSKYRITSNVVRKAVREAIGNETRPYWIARRVYQYVLGRLDYKLSGGWDAVPLLLERGTGSCSEYSFVLIALSRAAGIPARWVGGIVTRGDDAFVDNVFHRWVEIYLPGYGWIPVDPDRGDKATPRGQALGFGNLENTLMVTTVSGGESRYLGWNYNGNVRYRFKGRTRVYVETYGELNPIEETRVQENDIVGGKKKWETPRKEPPSKKGREKR